MLFYIHFYLPFYLFTQNTVHIQNHSFIHCTEQTSLYKYIFENIGIYILYKMCIFILPINEYIFKGALLN